MSDFGYKRDRDSFEEEKYLFNFGCRDCGHKWKRSIATSDPYSIKTPPCPHCRKRRKERDGVQEILDSGRAPAYTGTNVRNKAQDLAAEMVMADYGMTDVKSPTEIRQGESQAPKLPPAMQAAADNMFAPKKALDAVGMGRHAGLIARAASAGAYSPKNTNSPDPIMAAQADQRRANVMEQTTILNEPKGVK